jgi:YVTN family beta-propeller protein
MKRKTSVFLLAFLMACFSGVGRADESFGVFANANTNCIQFIDPVTNNVSPAWLQGDLGSSGTNLLDVVITPDGKTAIVSNYGNSTIYFIDISGGFNATPKLLGKCQVPFFPWDMAITPDGKYVLVTDGGSSDMIALINVARRKLEKTITKTKTKPVAVAIAPDGPTVITAGYSGYVYSYEYVKFQLYWWSTKKVLPSKPNNIAVSPDGKTVIVPGSPSAYAYELDYSELVTKPVIAMPAANGQSCVFNKQGDKAYYLSNSQSKGTQVIVLNVTGPGQVSPSGTSIKIWPKRGTSQLFGVDTIALDPSEKYIYVTNPSLSGGVGEVSIGDLTTNTQVGYIPAKGIPTGIAFTTIGGEDKESSSRAARNYRWPPPAKNAWRRHICFGLPEPPTPVRKEKQEAIRKEIMK